MYELIFINGGSGLPLSILELAAEAHVRRTLARCVTTSPVQVSGEVGREACEGGGGWHYPQGSTYDVAPPAVQAGCGSEGGEDGSEGLGGLCEVAVAGAGKCVGHTAHPQLETVADPSGRVLSQHCVAPGAGVRAVN